MYAVAIARGHAFNDGNKRTALVCALAHLNAEGIKLQRSCQLEDVMVDVAQGRLDEKDLARVFLTLHRANRQAQAE